MALDPRVPGLERRVGELEQERGPIAAELAEIATKVDGVAEDVRELREAVSERPSSVEFQRFRESVAAKARSPLPSLSEVEFHGPAWLGKVKLSGYSGVTLATVVFLVAVSVISWLVFK